jgi:tetratricopeptide (TPR) repeat protein
MISRAVAISPATAFFHNNLGNVYFDIGKLQEACESFKQAIAVKADFPPFHHNLGNCLMKLQQPVEAEQAYRRALELEPNFNRAACGLGQALLAQQKFGAAEPWFRQVLQSDPQDEEARNGLEQSMRAQDQVKPTAPPVVKPAATPQYGQVMRQPAASRPSQGTTGSLDAKSLAELRRQIADRLLQREEPQAIAAGLLGAGLAEEVVRREIQEALDHPYMQAGQAIATRLKKRDWVLNTYRTLAETAPAPSVVERKYRLSREEFVRDYYSTNRPVIIQGMLDNWVALEKWTPDYLREHYGHLTVEIQANRNADRNYETNMQKLRRDVLFGDYVDMVSSGATNDVYMTANNASRNMETLKGLWNDIDMLPEYLNPASPDKGFFWFGPAGTITPLHHDLTNNFMAQVRGRKHIKLIAAHSLPYVYNHLHCYSQLDLTNIDYARFPLLRNARIMDVILEPGEILFLPVGCWHYVKGLDMSITMTFTHFRFNNDFHSFYDTYHEI